MRMMMFLLQHVVVTHTDVSLLIIQSFRHLEQPIRVKGGGEFGVVWELQCQGLRFVLCPSAAAEDFS